MSAPAAKMRRLPRSRAHRADRPPARRIPRRRRPRTNERERVALRAIERHQRDAVVAAFDQDEHDSSATSSPRPSWTPHARARYRTVSCPRRDRDPVSPECDPIGWRPRRARSGCPPPRRDRSCDRRRHRPAVRTCRRRIAGPPRPRSAARSTAELALEASVGAVERPLSDR